MTRKTKTKTWTIQFWTKNLTEQYPKHVNGHRYPSIGNSSLSHSSCQNSHVSETDIAQMTRPDICKYTQILVPGSSLRLGVRCDRVGPMQRSLVGPQPPAPQSASWARPAAEFTLYNSSLSTSDLVKRTPDQFEWCLGLALYTWVHVCDVGVTDTQLLRCFDNLSNTHLGRAKEVSPRDMFVDTHLGY